MCNQNILFISTIHLSCGKMQYGVGPVVVLVEVLVVYSEFYVLVNPFGSSSRGKCT